MIVFLHNEVAFTQIPGTWTYIDDVYVISGHALVIATDAMGSLFDAVLTRSGELLLIRRSRTVREGT